MKINIGKNINLHVGTVFDYIKEYGKLSFAEKPFCEIDSLILSQFSYLKFDGIVPMIDELGKSVNLLQMKDGAKRIWPFFPPWQAADGFKTCAAIIM